MALALYGAPAAAQEGGELTICPGEERGTQYYLDSLELEGLQRTKPYVVYRELVVEPNQVVDCGSIEESIQRVRNTDLFREVNYDLVETEPGADEEQVPADVEPIRLRIILDEKWTALPLFQFSSGGGTYSVMLGANETNLMGHFIGIGGQFERIAGANSFFGWIDNPRTFGERLHARLEVGTQNRIFSVYDDEGEVDGGFLLRRFVAGGSLSQEWRWWFRTAAQLRFEGDEFSDELLSEEVAEEQGELPDPTRTVRGRLSATVGRIDQDEYLEEGAEATVGIEHANEALGSTHNLTRLTLDLSYLEILPLRSNLAFRAEAATSVVEEPQYRYYIGGLDAIRGFPYDRFNGEHYWLSSIEYRIPSIDMPWLALQHVGFIDAASVGDDPFDVVGLSGASTGIGLRILVPKIHGLVIRADYAFGLYGEVENPMNYGGAQFF